MRRWSISRQREWRVFRRALSRMGRILETQRNPHGGYTPAAAPRLHPLLELVMGEPRVIDAIGKVAACDEERKGVLSWADVRQGPGSATLRVNHKGTHERCAEALEAIVAALQRIGRRVSFKDLIRHPNQNGYVALIRVPDVLAPQRGFAR